MKEENKFMPMSEAAPHVAKVIQPIVAHYASVPAEVKGYYANLLKWAMRDLERFVRPAASKAALERGEAMGIGDVRSYIWLHQTSLMKDPKRSVFHWEHVSPVSDLVKQCLACNPADQADIIAILSQAKIAWILKDENKLLKSHGRGDDPLQHYRDVGIELVGL